MRLRDLIFRFMSPTHRREAEADSRAWFMTCGKCGKVSSIWDIGGVRYKAVGRPRSWFWCPACNKGSWSTIQRADEIGR